MDDIESALNDPKIFWNKWKKVGETDVIPTQPNITGEEWYNHFSNLHKENNDTNLENLEDFQNTNNLCRELDQKFAETEFQKVIKNLKNNKAGGYGSIMNEMIKHSPPPPPIALTLLLDYTNLCVEKSLISQHWCFDIINTIHKDESINDPNNYRGINISSVLLKIVCSLLNHRIQAFCSKRTSDHLLTLNTVVKKYATIGKKKLFACFVDFKKASDSVWHEGLFFKLKKIGIRGKTRVCVKDVNLVLYFLIFT